MLRKRATRGELASTLAKIGKASIKPVAELLNDENNDTRYYAVFTIAATNSCKAAESDMMSVSNVMFSRLDITAMP